jgi:hypothetical protein
MLPKRRTFWKRNVGGKQVKKLIVFKFAIFTPLAQVFHNNGLLVQSPRLQPIISVSLIHEYCTVSN